MLPCATLIHEIQSLTKDRKKEYIESIIYFLDDGADDVDEVILKARIHISVILRTSYHFEDYVNSFKAIFSSML